jgi:PAS domain S-box-containing protein
MLLCGLALLGRCLVAAWRAKRAPIAISNQVVLAELFHTSADAIVVVNADSGRLEHVNAAFEAISGYAPEAVLGKNLRGLGLLQDFERLWPRVRVQGQPSRLSEVPATLLTRRGQPKAILLSASLVEINGRGYWVASARDVTHTQRVRIEHEAMLRNAPVGVVFSRRWQILHGNPAFEAMFQWPAGSAAGRHVSEVFADRASYKLVDDMATPLLTQGQAVDFEVEVQRADGSQFWCRMAGRVIDPGDPSEGGIIWITEDVTERRRLDAALAASRDAAQAANRAKSAFLANTSHELRTPLNAVMGLAQLAQSPALDAQTRDRYLAQMVESARSLAGIVSDVLDVAKIEAGRAQLDVRSFELQPLLHALKESFEPLAQAKGLTLLWELDALPRRFNSDPHRLQQVLGNLIANAIKFTEAGQVRLRASTLPEGDLWLEVIDSGPGMSPAAQRHLFQPFSQGDVSSTRRFGGNGLGLAICREWVALAQGQLGVDSQVGLGSRFWLRWPESAVRGEDAASLAPPPAPPHFDPSGLKGKRVLVVEDNELNMLITSEMLAQWGLEVLQAPDGRSALRQMQGPGTEVDLVLMDLQMPDMSGFEATRALHALPGRQHLPVVALTAAALVDERDRALEAGMSAFVTKPIEADHLKRVLWMFLGQSRSQGQAA